jgi:hypothetical protein
VNLEDVDLDTFECLMANHSLGSSSSDSFGIEDMSCSCGSVMGGSVMFLVGNMKQLLLLAMVLLMISLGTDSLMFH